MNSKVFITRKELEKENWILRGVVTNPEKGIDIFIFSNKNHDLNIHYDFENKDLRIYKNSKDINNLDLTLFKGKCEYISDFQSVIKSF